jgi:hypothetical protein
MRFLRLLLLGALLVAVGVVPSQAQAAPGGPTIVYNTHTNLMLWAFVDASNPTKLAVLSSDPEFFTTSLCVEEHPQPGPDWLLVKRLDIMVAQMKWNSQVKGPLFTRVYEPVPFPTPEEFDWTYFCALVRGEKTPLLAEGISEFYETGINNYLMGPGANPWSWRAVGTLTAPGCTSGMAKFSLHHQYKAIDDIYSWIRVMRGPDLTCIGRR